MNFTDVSLTDSEKCSDLGLRFTTFEPANFLNIGSAKFGAKMAFLTGFLQPNVVRVFLIFRTTKPLKIFGTIVGLDSVLVVRLKTGLIPVTERGSYKLVNVDLFVAFRIAKYDFEISG